MENSTISGNSTTHDGGGIYLDGVAEINFSTIVGNSAHNGGGIYIDGDPEEGVERGLLHFSGTVIAGNTISFADYGTEDCLIGDHASVGLNKNNFVEDGSCEAALSGEPFLGPLAVNGGLTQTHAPQEESPLVDAVPSVQCALNTDQTGQTRPSGRGCDIGSVELQLENAPHSARWLMGGSLGVLGLVAVGLIIWVLNRKKRKVK
jgi:predicted outer membrane repeat protein